MISFVMFSRILRAALLGLLLLIVAAITAQNDIPIFHRPTLAVLDVKYSPDAHFLARVYANGRVQVINMFLNTAKKEIIFETSVDLPHPLVSARVDWSPNGTLLAAGIGSNIYIWDIPSARLLETIPAAGEDPLVLREADYYVPEGFSSLEWDSTGTRLMAQSESWRYTIWSTEQQEFIFDLTIGNESRPVVWLPGETHISYYDNYLDIAIQELVSRSTQVLPQVGGTCAGYHSISSNHDNTRIAWGTYNGCVVILDAETGNQVAGYKIGENDNPIWDVDWSPDGDKIVAVANDSTVQIVELATGNVTLIGPYEGSLYTVDWGSNNAISFGSATRVFGTILEKSAPSKSRI
jgi:WD40 repeat protein